MSRFLVDTNVLSELVRKAEPQAQVKRWFESADPDSLFASVMTFAEIRRGMELLPASKRRVLLERWLDGELLDYFGPRLLPQLRGRPVATIDGLLSATGIEHSLTIATRNVIDFANLGVHLFNPWDLPT